MMQCLSCVAQSFGVCSVTWESRSCEQSCGGRSHPGNPAVPGLSTPPGNNADAPACPHCPKAVRGLGPAEHGVISFYFNYLFVL